MTVVEQIISLQTDLAASMEAQKGLAAQVASSTTERDAARAEVAQAKAELVKAQETVKAAQDAQVKSESDHAATKKELNAAKTALANPAFADAAIKGNAKPVAEGGTPSNDEPLTFEQALVEYKKITDPKAQVAFRAEHAKELRLS